MKPSATTPALQLLWSHHVWRKPKLAHTETTQRGPDTMWREKELTSQPQATPASQWLKLNERSKPELPSKLPKVLTHNNHEKKRNGCCLKTLNLGVTCYSAIANQSSEKQRNVRKGSKTGYLSRTLLSAWFPLPSQDLMLLSSCFYRDAWKNEQWM